MTDVSIQSLSKQYPGNSELSLKSLSMEIYSGELVALLGPSGCGKTTVLKILAGLLAPDSGVVLFNTQPVLRKKPEERGAVMVFQNNLLFPYMNVENNIGFGLKMRKVPKPEIASRVEKMLALVKLSDFGKRKPMELSGGQQQRVALARALIVRPKVLLLDEPLSSLDAHLRIEMRELIRDLHQTLKMTTVFVTHDQEEAVVVADRIALILDGQMTQFGTPEAFYKRPADVATARFFGGVNFFTGGIKNEVFRSESLSLDMPENTPQAKGVLTFRPENVHVSTGDVRANTLQTTLANKQYLGTQTRLVLALGSANIEALVNPAQAQGLNQGDAVSITIAAEHLCFLPG